MSRKKVAEGGGGGTWSRGRLCRCKHAEIRRHELLFYHKVEGEGEAIDTLRCG